MVENKVSEWDNTAARYLLLHADDGTQGLIVIRNYCWEQFDVLLVKITTEQRHQ